MELSNSFEIPATVDVAWAVLTDVERIAPCMPGAQLDEIDGEEYRGVVRVKVGPITAQYKGTAHFVELDENAHRVVLRASGRETRGQGNATATITAKMRPEGTGTLVEIVTDLEITGKVAQFGRGIIADVSARLLGEFAERLEADVLQEIGPDGPRSDDSSKGGDEATSASTDGSGSQPSRTPSGGSSTSSATAEPVKIVGVVASSLAHRFVVFLRRVARRLTERSA